MDIAKIEELLQEFEEDNIRLLSLTDNKWFMDNHEDLTDKQVHQIIESLREDQIENPLREVSFTILLGENPRAAGRPQSTTRKTSEGKYVPVVYDGKLNKQFKNTVRDEVERQTKEGFQVFEGDFFVYINIFKKYLANFTKADKLLAEAGILRPLKTPDCDNYAKIVLDSLNGFLWLDDGQNSKLNTEKFYSIQPRIELEIYYKRKKFTKKQ